MHVDGHVHVQTNSVHSTGTLPPQLIPPSPRPAFQIFGGQDTPP